VSKYNAINIFIAILTN